jgi:hypothetical protein
VVKNRTREHASPAEETVYSTADKTLVPGLPHELEALRTELERAAVKGDWQRVAELARLLAKAECR